MESILDLEYNTYLENKERLLEWNEGKYVLIKEDTILAVYENREDARRDGYAVLGSGPFLIHQILREEPLYQLTYLPGGPPRLNRIR